MYGCVYDVRMLLCMSCVWFVHGFVEDVCILLYDVCMVCVGCVYDLCMRCCLICVWFCVGWFACVVYDVCIVCV